MALASKLQREPLSEALLQPREQETKKFWHLLPLNFENAPEPKVEAFFARAARWFVVTPLLLAFMALAGWLFRSPSLQQFFLNAGTMVPLTATLLTGMSLALASAFAEHPRVGNAFALLVLVPSALRLVELGTGLPLLPEAATRGLQLGTMSWLTSLAMVCLAVGSLLLKGRSRSALTAQALAICAGCLGAWSILARFYGAVWGAEVSYTDMSAPTALAVLMLAAALMVVRPYVGITALLSSRGLGGFEARRLLLAAVLFPFLVGWLSVLAQSAGVIDVTLSVTVLVLFTVLFFGTVIWLTSAQIHHLAAERERLRAHTLSMESEAQLREEFVAMLTHDLRSPLAAAKLSAQMVRRYPENPEARERNVARVVANIERADKLIHDMLDVSRLKAGETLPLDIRQCNLRELAAATVEHLRFIYPERVLRCEGDETVLGHWSCEGVARMLENLVTNALKYGARDREITVRCEDLGDRARFSVHNWGEPIAPEKLSSLFLPFRRNEGAATASQPGWGLGLALVRGLAEAHRGQVVAESNGIRGTVFAVTLPKR